MLSVPRVDYIIALDLFLQILIMTGMSKFPEFKIDEVTRSRKKASLCKTMLWFLEQFAFNLVQTRIVLNEDLVI